MFRKMLKLTHKILGLLLSILFLGWFLSGVVMIYHTFPGVSPADRLEKQAILRGEWPDKETLLSRLPDSAAIRSIAMEMYLDRPVVAFQGSGTPSLLYADSLQPVGPADAQTFRRTAAQWCPAPIERIDTLHALDQWIPFGRLRRELPIYKYTFQDEKGHQLYLASRTARVLQYTDKEQRLWAWLGAIPHWVYFTSLRQHQAAWINFVKWASGIGCIMCLAGLILSVQLAWRNRHKRLFSPYRKRWFKWHYASGLVFGLFAITFAFSGMMSLIDIPDWMKKAPGAKREWPRDGRGGADGEGRFEAAAYRLDYRKALASTDSVKRLDWLSWNGRPYYRLATDTRTMLVDASDSTQVRPFRLTEEMILEEAARMYGDRIAYRLEWLTDYDEDYYGRKKERLPLPVYRLTVEDALHTRHYYDPATLMQRRFDDDSRLRRLLYSGLHALDFKFLVDRPVLWHILMYGLLAGGSFLSLTGVVLSVKWVVRKARHRQRM